MYEVKSDKLDVLGMKRDGFNNYNTARKELSVRSKKPKAGERVSKGDGSVILVCQSRLLRGYPSTSLGSETNHGVQTANAAYTVSKLPALPDRIRADSQST
jgi:nuclear pore complex protein Nup133